MSDGTLLWIGNVFDGDNKPTEGINDIQIYSINPDNGQMDHLGEIENIVIDGESYNSYEPYAIELDDGSLLTVFYAHNTHWSDPAVIMQQHWNFE